MHNQRTHHHIHQRKRNVVLTDEYVKPRNYVKLLDKTCIFFSVLMPATTLPQIYKIYATQNVVGLSLSMWVLYTIGVIPFLLYGIVHKEKPLIILNVLWLIAQFVIIVGILLYS